MDFLQAFPFFTPFYRSTTTNVINTCCWLALVVLLGGLLASCDTPVESDDGEGSDDDIKEGDIKPYTGGIRVGWDYRTLTEVYGGSSSYARFHRLDDGRIICTFERRGASMITFSEDEGKTWSEPQTVVESKNGVIAAVPELIQLESGEILMAYNPRPPDDNQDPSRRFAIKLKISRDGGSTWEHQADVYEGGYQGTNSVAEPIMIQLDSGELQLYFANEYRYPNTNDQDITMLRSFDKGETWEDEVIVSYRPGYRDGMPVPVILKNNGGIAMAIEDNGLSGDFKPVIVWSSMSDNWTQGTVGADSPRRWRALAKGSRLAPGDYGGGPYLVQLDNGSTILSFQSNKGRNGPWRESTMMMAIGNGSARFFHHVSEPFDVPKGRRALWNSLFVKDQQTITAVSTTTAFNTVNPDYQQVYAIDGHIISEQSAAKADVELDGELTENVWKTATKTFVGARSQTVARMSTAWDEDYLYAAFEVEDPDLWRDSGDWEADDGVQLYLAAEKLVKDNLEERVRRVAVPIQGDPTTYRGTSNGFLTIMNEVGIEAEIKRKGTVNNAGDKDEGYTVELRIPWDTVGEKPEIGIPWGFHFSLTSDYEGGSAEVREGIAGNKSGKPSTWCKITLVE